MIVTPMLPSNHSSKMPCLGALYGTEGAAALLSGQLHTSFNNWVRTSHSSAHHQTLKFRLLVWPSMHSGCTLLQARGRCQCRRHGHTSQASRRWLPGNNRPPAACQPPDHCFYTGAALVFDYALRYVCLWSGLHKTSEEDVLLSFMVHAGVLGMQYVLGVRILLYT